MPTVNNIADQLDIVGQKNLDSPSSGGAWGNQASTGRPPGWWWRGLQLGDTSVLETSFHEARGEQWGRAEAVPRWIGPQLSAEKAGHLLPARVQEGGGSTAGKGQAEREEGADRAGDPRTGEAKDGSAAAEVEP